jgi:hypothetical protein
VHYPVCPHDIPDYHLLSVHKHLVLFVSLDAHVLLGHVHGLGLGLYDAAANHVGQKVVVEKVAAATVARRELGSVSDSPSQDRIQVLKKS